VKPFYADKTVIAGIGQTEFSKASGRTELQLASEAILAAVEDAGLTTDDIDGMVTFAADSNDELSLMRSLGVPELHYTARTRGGGGGSCATVQLAASAVASGAATNVVVYRAFNERSGRRFGQPMTQNEGVTGKSGPTPDVMRTMRAMMSGRMPGYNLYHVYSLDTPAKVYSLWYQRYMYEFGVTNEDFGRYGVVARKHASTNPAAWFYQRPITLEDHQASRWIVEPILRKLDCCQESDGGVALVVTSAERARDLPQPPVRILAAAQGHTRNGEEMYDFYNGDRTDFKECRVLGRELYDASGLSPDDIDVTMIYENFTPVVFLQLEALGFCGRGEAKDFIADGNIEIGGKTPVNTNGGLLGEAYIHGVNNILEGVRQMRGTAANQVPGAEHTLISAGRSGLILGKS
jgi:acetyl-CoA acetyltransferase